MSDPFGQFAGPIREALKEWGVVLPGGRVESLAGFSGDGVFRVDLSPDSTREDSLLHEPSWMVVKAIDTSKRFRPLVRMADGHAPLVRKHATIECRGDLQLGDWRVRIFDWNGASRTLRDVADDALAHKEGAVEELKQALEEIPAGWLTLAESGTWSKTWSEAVRSWPLEFLVSQDRTRRQRAYAMVTPGVIVGVGGSGCPEDPVALLKSLFEAREGSGLCRHTLRKGCLHGDLHGGNILLSRDHGTLCWTTIDLEDSQSDSSTLGYDIGLLEASLFCQLLKSESQATQAWVLNELMGGSKKPRPGLTGDGALLQLKALRDSTQNWLQKAAQKRISPEHQAQFMLGRVAAGVVLASYQYGEDQSGWPLAAAMFAAHATARFLEQLAQLDPEFEIPLSCPPLPLPKKTPLGNPANLRMVLAALCLSRQTTIRELADEAFPRHGTQALLAATRGTPFEAPHRTQLYKIAKRSQLFTSSQEMDAFLDTPLDELVEHPKWGSSRLGRSLAERELCELLRSYFMYRDFKWIRGAQALIDELKRSPADDWTYRQKLRSIYAYAATHLGANDMLAAAREDFNVQAVGPRKQTRWKELIDTDPECSHSHLAYSARVMADEVAATMTAQQLHFPEFRMVEGGVGGGQTTYFMMKRLLASTATRLPGTLPTTLRYKGYEIVPETAEVVNGWLAGANYHPGCRSTDPDPRMDLFFKLHRERLVDRLHGSRFVDCIPMEWGISELHAQQCRELSLFLSSYAFHHVPNGEAIRHYLANTRASGEAAIFHERPEATIATDPRGKLIAETIVDFSYKLCRAQRLKDSAELVALHQQIGKMDIDSLGPAKVALSLLNTEMSDEGLKEFHGVLRSVGSSVVAATWRRAILERALVNPQQRLLSDVVALLSSGGFVAIADPDGTSYFNRDGVRDGDPELSIANFLLQRELANLLRNCGLRIITQKTVARVHTNGHDSYVLTAGPASIDQPRAHPREDPNLGYFIIAQKP